jgi:hypothetical protein
MLGHRGGGQSQQRGGRRAGEPVPIAEDEYGAAQCRTRFGQILVVAHVVGVPVQRGHHRAAVRTIPIGQPGVDGHADRSGGGPRIASPRVGERIERRAQPPMKLSTRAPSSALCPND